MRIAAVLLLLAGAGLWYGSRPIEHPPGVLVPQAPRQTAETEARPIPHRGYTLAPVARFDAEGRVLGRKAYRTDEHARLAPYDLAVGWGPMSDSAVLDAFTITQMRRFYRWQTDRYPIPRNDVIRHSTNIHLIPATAAVEGAIARIREGHVVRLQGRLVNVRGPDGSRWRTSTSRTDAGMGACEILWLESVEILTP